MFTVQDNCLSWELDVLRDVGPLKSHAEMSSGRLVPEKQALSLIGARALWGGGWRWVQEAFQGRRRVFI